jgi:hypothetical protein
VSIGEWLVVALARGAGIVRPPVAASGGEGTISVLGLGLFAGAVTSILLLIERHFDRFDQTAH